MSSGTSLTYNGITFDEVLTHSISQTVIKTPDGMDYLYTRIEITVQGLLNMSLNPASGSGASSMATSIAKVRGCLMQPRKILSYTINGDTAVTAPAAGNKCDSKGGPFPLSFDVTKIAGFTTAICTYKIETYITECCNKFSGKVPQRTLATAGKRPPALTRISTQLEPARERCISTEANNRTLMICGG